MNKGGVAIAAVAVIAMYFMLKKWTPPLNAKIYLDDIRQAELKHDMPKNLLARLLYQESRFRDDIIKGDVKSSAGAVGIAQIVPKWHPDINPLNAIESIHYAGDYLASLKKRYQSWEVALAAYNWGLGNVDKAKEKHGESWLSFAPRETQNYVKDIWGDIA